MSWGAVIVAGVGYAINYSNAETNRQKAEQQAIDAKTERDTQRAALDAEKAKYRSMQFKNPFANMENTFEDLTVNQQQAQFQAKQGAQQRANIMQNMRGAAGGSGIAGLAQMLSNQGALQTQRISAQIGQQEAMNQQLAAKGAAQVQAYERQGQQWVQQAEMDRQSNLLGMQYGQTTGANLAYQNALANQMQADIVKQQVVSDAIMGTAEATQGQWGGETGNVFTHNLDGEEVNYFRNWDWNKTFKENWGTIGT